MQGDIIAALQAEEAELERKLKAVRGVLAVYGGAPAAAAVRKPFVAKPLPGSGRMTEYGRRVREEVAIILKALAPAGAPIPTAALVEMLQQRGVEVRGQEPRNALSAILSRDKNVKNHGRSGWTLSDEVMMEHLGFGGPKENEPPNDDVAGGSDTEESADRKSALFS